MLIKLISWKIGIFVIFVISLALLTYIEWRSLLVQKDMQPGVPLENFHYTQPTLSPKEDLVVVYNRVPKTGSTSFVNIAYDLCKRNHFRVLHINISANVHVLSLQNQVKFAQNVSEWDSMKPAFYHGHMAFLNFQRFGISKPPLYINLIRKPLDRLVSYYYFLRYGDNFRPHLVRRKSGDTMSFDDCVASGSPDCKPEHMWLQIPFFCGHAAECWRPGNKWALEQAKKNLVSHYLVVGLTEEMEQFVRVLEVVLPRFFAGATQHYLTSDKSHLRVTSQKGQPSTATISLIQNTPIWKLENEFYEFASQQFKFIMKRLFVPPYSGKEQIFFYEKIRPK